MSMEEEQRRRNRAGAQHSDWRIILTAFPALVRVCCSNDRLLTLILIEARIGSLL